MKIFNSILSKLTNNASKKQESELAEWLNADSANQQDFDLYETIWKESAQMKDFVPFESDQAWSKISHNFEDTGEEKTARIRPLWRSLAIASSFLIMVIAGSLLLVNRDPYVTVATTSDVILSDKIITLPDGTVVTLGENSELTYGREIRRCGKL
jgi:ferric-dicitrate binding protein FerR (iron transport regulator)